MGHEVHCLEPAELDLFLERRRRAGKDNTSIETSLAAHLVEVLRKANEFVPSEAGSILLDDPTMKASERSQNRLTFIAAFGEKASVLAGRRIRATEGIAGHVYLSGQTHHTADARQDRLFHPGIDEATAFKTQALIAIPIQLGDEVCGVLELIRENAYNETEVKLLKIFAGYLSVSIQNLLDARYAQTIAKRDNLTSLYNDRYLHIALADSVSECHAAASDLAVIFIDLDFFKRVNDTHGHLAGSQVLREVGSLLYEASGKHAGMACRYGGDEFVIILPHRGLDVAIDLAEEIRTAVLETTFCGVSGSIQPVPLHLKGITCSVGIATLRRHLGDSDLEQAKTTLLHLADAAMYVAKETGRNRTAVAGEPVRRRYAVSTSEGADRSSSAGLRAVARGTFSGTP